MGKKHLLTVALVLFAVESLCASYLLKVDALISFVPILYFVSGIGIALIFLFLPKPKLGLKIGELAKTPFTYIKLSIIVVLGFLVFYFSSKLMADNPIDYHNADMLPIIKTMGERFNSGQWQHVYDPVPQIWKGGSPVYLPAMWRPFAAAVALHIDVRWTTVVSLFLAFAIPIFMLSLRKPVSYFYLMIVAMLCCWLLSEDDTHGFISLTEEGVIVLYYTLLVFAIASEKIYFISLLAIFCMLSRYALIGWLAAYFVFLLLNKKKREAIMLTMIGILSFLLLFILPFGWGAFLHLLQLPGSYIGFSKRVWADSPNVFVNSPGLAKFFVPDKTLLLHILLVTCSFMVPTGFMLLCNYYSRRIKLENIPMATLKMALVIFYALIDVPYLYLFYTSAFVSLAAIAIFLGNTDGQASLQTGIRST